MYGNAITACDIPGYFVTRNRLAAFAKFDQNIINAFNHDPAGGLLFADTTNKLIKKRIVFV
jgi:hypothetical protein